MLFTSMGWGATFLKQRGAGLPLVEKCLPYLHRPHDFGPVQWARGDVGLKPSAAARPWALTDCEWRAAAQGLKPLRLPRSRVD